MKNEKTDIPILIGNVYGDYNGGDYGGCVWDKEGIMPTLKTTAAASQQCVVIDEDD